MKLTTYSRKKHCQRRCLYITFQRSISSLNPKQTPKCKSLLRLARWWHQSQHQRKHLAQNTRYFSLQSTADVQYVITFFIVAQEEIFHPVFCRVSVFIPNIAHLEISSTLFSCLTRTGLIEIHSGKNLCAGFPSCPFQCNTITLMSRLSVLNYRPHQSTHLHQSPIRARWSPENPHAGCYLSHALRRTGRPYFSIKS